MEHLNKEVMKNLAFFPASEELRKDLYKLGLYPTLVRIEDKLQFMVETNQLRLITELANKHGIKQFHVSDNRRQIFLAQLENQYYTFMPTKLGRLTRLSQKPENGKSFLIVTEENQTYYYIVE